MSMSEQEKQAYLDAITPEIDAMVDEAFLKRFGRTYREARITHGEQNGDSSAHPKDSWEQIREDFPNLFGTEDDES